MPLWTKAGSWSLGRDPLGIQATSVRIYRSLVPGVTNVTNRLRYYSYYCWVVKHYEQTEHADDDARWRVFIRRAEALYALACEAENSEQSDGLAGSDWARGYLRQISAGKIDLRPYTDRPGDRAANQYLLATRGNFGQFYVASMIEVGLLSPSSGVPIVSETRGRALAAAFAKSVGKDIEHLLAAAIKTGKLTRDALQTIGKAVHPSYIRANSEEMELLRDFLLANTPDIDGNTVRRSSAWLLLDLLRHGVSLDDEAAIRRAFYHRTLPDGTPYLQTGRTIDRWRAFQANELCHIALEAWLNAITDKVRAHQGLPPDVLITELISKALPNVVRGSVWRFWAADAGTATTDDEDKLIQTVLEGLWDQNRAQDTKVLKSAVRLLAILWVRWSHGSMGVRDEIAQFAGSNGRSVNTAITEALRRHVVLEHLAIAGRKLAASGTFTYHFTLADGLLSNGTPTTYGYTNPRLRNLWRFLRDAKLCDGDKVTPVGLSFLNENQPA